VKQIRGGQLCHCANGPPIEVRDEEEEEAEESDESITEMPPLEDFAHDASPQVEAPYQLRERKSVSYNPLPQLRPAARLSIVEPEDRYLSSIMIYRSHCMPDVREEAVISRGGIL